jgi:hypothetical protein
MQDLGAVWLYPIILVAGALQAWGPPSISPTSQTFKDRAGIVV